MLLGARGLRGLRGVRHLADQSMDDQAAVLGRALVEALIDVQYLNASTVRRTRDGREVELSPDVKANLFGSFKSIAAYRVFTGAKKEAVAGSKHYGDAVALRREKGIPDSPYWSGISNWKTVEELLVKAEGDAERTKAIRALREMFEHLSFFTHANPNDAPYLQQSSSASDSLSLTDEYTHVSILAFCATAGVGLLWEWERFLNGPKTRRHERLHSIASKVIPPPD